jgi:N-acetylglucosamine-6-phosphate deacetylase
MGKADRATRSLLLRGAKILLPQGILESGSLLVEDGRISRLLKPTEEQVRNADVSLELNGLRLLPGFIDVHIHGAVGIDVLEATADDLHRVARFLAKHGVTAWLPTLVPASEGDYQDATQAIGRLIADQDERATAARALGLHYEGPFINAAQCGALRSAYFRVFPNASALDALAIVENAAHMITVAPEIDGGVELVGELRRRGWTVSIGHTRADVDVLNRACQAGAHHITHFMNAMSPLHHRSPGPIGWGLSRDDVTCDVIADGVHVDPFMLQLLLKIKKPDRLSLISDAIAAAGMGDGEYKIWGETIEVTRGRTSNARGKLSGSVITMLDAVRMMLSIGASEIEVARMAATNPARLLRIESEYGSIEEGKRADLVALDAEGKVRLTIIGGRVAYEAGNNDYELPA